MDEALRNIPHTRKIVEIELLGIVWAVEKCRLFLEGLSNFEVVTDHRPLIPIINGHRLDE